MVIGAAGELPKPPEKPVVFLEGMHNRGRYYMVHLLTRSLFRHG